MVDNSNCYVHGPLAEHRFCECVPDPRYCSRCGISEEDEQDNLLTDFTVECADGEEGFASITQLICGDCLPKMMADLQAIGFKDHRHGGINYLEDEDCPGYGLCPTPSEYGNYIVPHDTRT